MEKDLCTIATWSDFKKESKKQFYPENAALETRAKLRRLTQRESVWDYVKEFFEVILKIPDYHDDEALLAFLDGLQHWVRLKV